jgi:iron complex outermembrane receptor protein
MLVNAASSKVNGIDGELVWVAPIEVGHLSFRASASYLDSKYKDYPNALIYIPISTGGNRTGRIDASGNYSSQAPKFTSSLGFSYEIPVGDDRSVSFDTNWYHNDGFFWDYANRLRQPAYDIVNAQLSLSKADSWRVRLWVKNLTNEKYYSFISSGTFGDTGAAAAPRTYGASLQFEF